MAKRTQLTPWSKLVMKRYKMEEMEEMEEHNFLEMVALTSQEPWSSFL